MKGAVLAIDPGTTQSAWVCWDGEQVLDFGLEPNETILEHMQSLRGRPEWFHHHEPTTLAVEMIASYGMPVGREVFETCVWIGRFIEAWAGPYSLVYRKDVKLELCDSPRANDATIRQALIDRVGPQGRKATPGPTYGIKADMWAALGVAVTWWDTVRPGIGAQTHEVGL